MKKVKIMLTAMAIIAVVGGALAFKAKTASIYCSSQSHTGNDCPFLDNYTLGNVNDFESSWFCTTQANKPCTAKSYIKFDD